MKRPRFTNPHMADLRRSLWDFVLWKIGRYDDTTPQLTQPRDFTYPAPIKPFQRDKPSALWIGHSTYLIEVDGLVFLTDPVWDSYCSPVPIRALRRYSEPPIALAALPPIDFVLLSHNHYDHLDAKTVQTLHRLHPQIHWIVPEGVAPWFARRKIHSVTELPRWATQSVKTTSITAVPAQHFSGRTLWDKNKTNWNGYVVQTPTKTIYFTGDTGYNSKDFKAIGAHFPPMDLSLIPIGTYSPQKFMQPVHISPYEAVQIHEDVKSRFSLGMHWNTFRLSDEPHDRPPYDLFLAMQEKKLPLDTFLPIPIGIYTNF